MSVFSNSAMHRKRWYASSEPRSFSRMNAMEKSSFMQSGSSLRMSAIPLSARSKNSLNGYPLAGSAMSSSMRAPARDIILNAVAPVSSRWADAGTRENKSGWSKSCASFWKKQFSSNVRATTTTLYVRPSTAGPPEDADRADRTSASICFLSHLSPPIYLNAMR
eukprot:3920821-Pyramimonas_sp.AAC.1